MTGDLLEGFLTGSRVYGVPHDESDVDLVVWVPHPEDRKILSEQSETCGPVRYGKLNLIIPRSVQEFRVWREVTGDLTERALSGSSVAKSEAIDIFHKRFLEAGVRHVTGLSGGGFRRFPFIPRPRFRCAWWGRFVNFLRDFAMAIRRFP